jgi:hypothetical protein
MENMRKQFDNGDWGDSVKGQKWILKDSVGKVKIYHKKLIKKKAN